MSEVCTVVSFVPWKTHTGCPDRFLIGSINPWLDHVLASVSRFESWSDPMVLVHARSAWMRLSWAQ